MVDADQMQEEVWSHKHKARLWLMSRRETLPFIRLATKRDPTYTQKEDLLLCECWVKIGIGPIYGVEKNYKMSWRRICDQFHELKHYIP